MVGAEDFELHCYLQCGGSKVTEEESGHTDLIQSLVVKSGLLVGDEGHFGMVGLFVKMGPRGYRRVSSSALPNQKLVIFLPTATPVSGPAQCHLLPVTHNQFSLQLFVTLLV